MGENTSHKKSELHEKYDDILNRSFGAIEERLPTVFDISSYPHYENVISNWYAFFLDAKNPHGLGNLFYESLCELTGRDQGKESPEIEREFPTKSGRIDILLHEGKEGDQYVDPIIIENKIYHYLANDLKDYRDSIPISDNSSKTFLILCLDEKEVISELRNQEFERVNETTDQQHTDTTREEPASDGKTEKTIAIRMENEKFLINVITHQQYMEAVRKNLPDHILHANIKYLTLLQDFMMNIERLTKAEPMDEDQKYYFEHAKKINELLEVREKSYQFIIDKVRDELNTGKYQQYNLKWNRSKASEGEFSVSAGHSGEQWYYVILDGLNYTIKLWMSDESWNRIPEELRDNIHSKLLDGQDSHVFNSGNKSHRACVTYAVKNMETGKELDKYHEIIIKRINQWLEILNLENKNPGVQQTTPS